MTHGAALFVSQAYKNIDLKFVMNIVILVFVHNDVNFKRRNAWIAGEETHEFVISRTYRHKL